MQIELSRDEAELLRDVLKNEIHELDTEINRTDSLRYKRGLRDTDRTIADIVGRLTAALGSLATIALLMAGCARADDPTPGPATDASITAAVKAELYADNFTPALHMPAGTVRVAPSGRTRVSSDSATAVAEAGRSIMRS